MTLPESSDDINGGVPEPQPTTPEEAERFKQARNSAKRLYLILLAIGLAIGILASIGVVSLLQRFGLTDVPDQFEQSE